MCSNSKWDMAELLSGPVANLVGMGIKAFVNGTPIGPRTSGAQRPLRQSETTKEFYDNVEAHLKGALQILEPAMEIKKILSGECKSATHQKSDKTSNAAIQYYTPQNSKKSQCVNCPNRCCAIKKPEHREYNDKSASSMTSYSCSRNKDSSTLQASKINSTKQRTESSSNCKKSSKMSSSSVTSETGAKSRCGGGNKKDCRSLGEMSRRQHECASCKISLKNNRSLIVLPCHHVFCYTCLGKLTMMICQTCDKSFSIKNVTHIEDMTF